jgi:hypothetical protein
MTALSGAAGARYAYLGVARVLIGTIGFSGKAVIVKLAYHYPVRNEPRREPWAKCPFGSIPHRD